MLMRFVIGMALALRCAEALVSMMMGDDDGELREWLPDSFRLSRMRSLAKL